jgi:UDP-2-acetamido-3-amino-2,3-dideoxy-glucuronate N-acetyltransferase
MIHKTADIHKTSKIDKTASVWNWVKVREKAEIGKNCILAKGVYVGKGVVIGNNVKIQNNVSIYEGVVIEDGVFIGPHVVFANDRYPSAINSDGKLKSEKDWKLEKTTVRFGASIGANATILPGITIGKYALIGAGSVVTKNVPDFGLAYGNPAKLIKKKKVGKNDNNI